ncbi:hypothetical protein [Streptomyces sporangiiformans]|uniref:hypothetical protein n=1 Tax=Streptomyces sporangiiformans TaxID=2315329 RepID=UPI003B8A84CC
MPHPLGLGVVGTYVHTYDAPRRLTYTSPIPAMRPTPDTTGSHSATPIYDALYSEFRRLFRALPGDRSGEEELGFTAFGSIPLSTRPHGTGSTGSVGPTGSTRSAVATGSAGSMGTGTAGVTGSAGAGQHSGGSYSSGSYHPGPHTPASHGTRYGAAHHGTGHLAAHGHTASPTWQPVARQHTSGLIPALPPSPRRER